MGVCVSDFVKVITVPRTQIVRHNWRHHQQSVPVFQHHGQQWLTLTVPLNHTRSCAHRRARARACKIHAWSVHCVCCVRQLVLTFIRDFSIKALTVSFALQQGQLITLCPLSRRRSGRGERMRYFYEWNYDRGWCSCESPDWSTGAESPLIIVTDVIGESVRV